jgi:hypothetical protein
VAEFHLLDIENVLMMNLNYTMVPLRRRAWNSHRLFVEGRRRYDSGSIFGRSSELSLAGAGSSMNFGHGLENQLQSELYLPGVRRYG